MTWGFLVTWEFWLLMGIAGIVAAFILWFIATYIVGGSNNDNNR